MTGSLVLRRMAVGDLEAVVELDRISFSLPWSLGSYRYELLENPNAHLWVAEDQGQIVGFLTAWLVLDELHIGTVAVHSDLRRRGIAAQLVETSLRDGIAKGAQKSHLEVRKSNLPAQSLYRGFGFETVGERKRYYPDNREDAILMSADNLGKDYLHWLDSGRLESFVSKV